MFNEYLIHFNPNHDPKTGRFAPLSAVDRARKRAVTAAKTKADVDDIIGTFNSSDRKKHGLLKSKGLLKILVQYLRMASGSIMLKNIKSGSNIPS